MQFDRRATCVFLVCLFVQQGVALGGSVAMSISFLNGAPLVLSPSAPTPIQILISPNGDTILSGSVALFHRVVPGAFQPVALTPGGGNAYSGALPAATCDTIVQWYVEAEGADSGVVTAPFGGAGAPFEAVVGTTQPIVSYDFQTATGWSVSGVPAGAWAVGVPVACNRGDPPTDYDGSGSCYLTQPSIIVSPPTCDSDVDNGTTRLMSPVFNLSAHSNPHVRYARWFHNATAGEPLDDAFSVQISDDGGTNWNPLETVGPLADDPHPEVLGGWHPRILRINDHVTSRSAIRFRFVVSDLSTPSTVEAGLDAFAIVNLTCGGVACMRGDMTQDGVVDGRDVNRFTRLMIVGGAAPAEICAGDLEPAPDGALDAGDVSTFAACIMSGGCG